MNAFAAAARVLFRDPHLSVAASYVPAAGSAAVPLRVILSSPTDAVAGGFAQGRGTAANAAADILVEDVPERPVKDATLTFTEAGSSLLGQVRKVAGAATQYARGLVWKVTLVR